MSSLLVALGRIIIPYRLISLTFGMVLAAFYQTEAATITAKVTMKSAPFRKRRKALAQLFYE